MEISSRSSTGPWDTLRGSCLLPTWRPDRDAAAAAIGSVFSAVTPFPSEAFLLARVCTFL